MVRAGSLMVAAALCVSAGVLGMALGVAGQAEVAVCTFSGTTADAGVFGDARVVAVGPGEVDVQLNVSNVTVNPDSLHAIHVHEFGDASDPSGGGAGGHWNPSGEAHGCPGVNATTHAGDMGSWNFTGGALAATKRVNMTLSGNQSIVGRAIVLHADPDSCAGASGNAGARLAVCVLGVANVVGNGAASPPATAAGGAVQRASCALSGTSTGNAQLQGTVWFTAGPGNSTTVVAEVFGLSGPGAAHGFHVHAFGDLTQGATLLSAGGHFNPNSVAHSIPGSGLPRHVGDMGNLRYFNASASYYYFENDLIRLDGPNSVVGRAVILHALEDNCTGATGFAGSRLAGCVIGVQSAAAPAPASVPASLPTTQNISSCPGAGSGTTTAAAGTAGTTGTTGTTGFVIPTTGTTTAFVAPAQPPGSLAPVSPSDAFCSDLDDCAECVAEPGCIWCIGDEGEDSCIERDLRSNCETWFFGQCAFSAHMLGSEHSYIISLAVFLFIVLCVIPISVVLCCKHLECCHKLKLPGRKDDSF